MQLVDMLTITQSKKVFSQQQRDQKTFGGINSATMKIIQRPQT